VCYGCDQPARRQRVSVVYVSMPSKEAQLRREDPIDTYIDIDVCGAHHRCLLDT